ncbi:unnamed protein product [Cuscuta europaea]|uniref:Uncharacterized protein n=1 Tax=Cuscuta europaea TaxID=41803 RepID=A0A9P0ZW33_CUSEU|nr:unnamed protein product [Cuscuta europaea]
MAGKKQGKGVATPSVNTRSRAAVGFNALDGLDDNFPALHGGGKSGKQTVDTMADPGMCSDSAKELLEPEDVLLSFGKQRNATKPAAPAADPGAGDISVKQLAFKAAPTAQKYLFLYAFTTKLALLTI